MLYKQTIGNKTLLAIERDGLSRTKYDALCSDDISYSDIEGFIDEIYEIKYKPSFQNHTYELKDALASFRECPPYGSCAEKRSKHL